MPRNEAFTKAQRLGQIQHWLYHNPHGMTVTELARQCSVTRRTVQRDLRDLQVAGIPLWQDDGYPPRYGIAEGYYLPPVHLDLDEVLALFLAARLLARYADSYDPHIAQALGKLAGILPEPIARHVHATIRSLPQVSVLRAEEGRLDRVLGVLAVGWAEGRAVRIRHRAASSARTHEYLFRPYFIEPSGEGKATHAIGYASYFDGLHTFKVERIVGAELTDEHYEIPPDFDGPRLLASAWGIMYGDEATEVALHFVPGAARRVHETRWHPSQELSDLQDGGCLLKVWVAHPEEMRYWVLGWGSQVEVLAPAALREEVAAEAARMAEVYRKEEL